MIRAAIGLDNGTNVLLNVDLLYIASPRRYHHINPRLKKWVKSTSFTLKYGPPHCRDGLYIGINKENRWIVLGWFTKGSDIGRCYSGLSKSAKSQYRFPNSQEQFITDLVAVSLGLEPYISLG